LLIRTPYSLRTFTRNDWLTLLLKLKGTVKWSSKGKIRLNSTIDASKRMRESKNYGRMLYMSATLTVEWKGGETSTLTTRSSINSDFQKLRLRGQELGQFTTIEKK
jgi:hypothetical protein